MRIFGIDPGSERTGYGCVETDGRRHRLVACGAITSPAGDSFPHRLARIHDLLRDVVGAGDDDHQHAGTAERDEFDPLQHGRKLASA